MLNSWTNKAVRFFYGDEVTCSSFEYDLSNYKPQPQGFFSRALTLCTSMLRAPGTFFFNMLMRRYNPYPGTFKELETDYKYVWAVKSKNWVVGLGGLLITGVPYLMGSGLRYLRNSQQANGMTIVNNQPLKAPPKLLKVITRNTALVPDSLHGRLNMRNNDPRVSELVASFLKPLKEKNRPNIICLQEVFDEAASDKLAALLSKEFPYIIHKIAPSGIGLPSGLFIASKFPILRTEFIQFPKTFSLRQDHFISRRFNPDFFCNKGVLISLIDVNDEKIIVVNTHCQPTTGTDPLEMKDYQDIRKLQLRIITQATFDFVAQLEENEIKPTKIIMTGDFNCTNSFGPDVILNDRDMNKYFFKDFFPGEAIDTWMKHYNPKLKQEHDLWNIEERNKDSTTTLKDVQLDHAGVFYIKDLRETNKTSVYFDQGHSKNQPTASSDHAGLLVKFSEKNKLT